MALLETRGLVARYGDFQALFGVDLTLERGETIAIIGANGAGKTTLLRSISGVLANDAQQVLFEDQPIGALGAAHVVKRGIAMVARRAQALPVALCRGKPSRRTGRPLDRRPMDPRHRLRSLSRAPRTAPFARNGPFGGQQQMVAIGRALMSNPAVLLCDEISLGLAPVVIRDIYAAFPAIKAAGASLVIVEQDIGQALKVSDRVYCMMEGRVTLSGRPADLSREAIHDAYFGVHA